MLPRVDACRLSALSVAFALTALGCLAARPVAAPTVQGQRITVYAFPEAPLCAHSTEEIELFVEQTAAYLGVPPPAHFEYDLFPYDQANVCVTRDGCANGSGVHSSRWMHYHELVHVAAAPLGLGPSFLVEGLAEALRPLDLPEEGSGMPSTGDLRDPRDVPLEQYLESEAFQSAEPATNINLYGAAGTFVRWFLRVHGSAKFLAWFRSLDTLSDNFAIAQSFQTVTGQPFAEALVAWRSVPLTSLLPQPQTLSRAGCAGSTADPPAATGTGPFVRYPGGVPACVTEVTPLLGGVDARGLTLRHPGIYTVAAYNGPPPSLILGDCDGDRVRYTANRSIQLLMDLEPGHYSLAAWQQYLGFGPPAPSSNAADTLQLAALTEALPARCEQAPVLHLDTLGIVGAHYFARTDLWPTQDTRDDGSPVRLMWLRLPLPLTETLPVALSSDDPAVRVEVSLCDTPCDLATCGPFEAQHTGGRPVRGGEVTLRLRATPSAQFTHLQL